MLLRVCWWVSPLSLSHSIFCFLARGITVSSSRIPWAGVEYPLNFYRSKNIIVLHSLMDTSGQPESDSDDDSYYDRLCAAAPDDMEEDTQQDMLSAHRQQYGVSSGPGRDDAESDYFDRVQRAGEAESGLVRAEDDPVWLSLRSGLLRSAQSAASSPATAHDAPSSTENTGRILVAAEDALRSMTIPICPSSYSGGDTSS